MSYQKTYHGKSANQILSGAIIIETNAAFAEISHADNIGWHLYQDDDGDLIIRDYDGIVVSLICGKMAKEKLQTLVEACDAKQAEILRAADQVNGTDYAEYL